MVTAQPGQSEGEPLDHSPRSRGASIWLLAALCAGAVYLPTMAPGVLWGDSGNAQLRVLTGAWCDSRELARTHVTYYATAIALHKASGLSAAWCANLVAALAGIVTVANAACLMSIFVRQRIALLCGTALLLFSHTLWQLSTGAEVVTFSTMMLSFELVMAVQFIQSRQRHWLVLAALANGLGWSTHNFAMLMWPAYLVIILSHRELIPAPRWRSLAAALGAWLVGCLPLLVLLVMEYQQRGEAGETLRSLLVGIYSRSAFNTDVSLRLLGRVLAFVVLCFPTPLILLGPWGWVRFRRAAPPGAWLFLTVGALAYTIFAARYPVADQYTFMVPSYVFLTLFVAVGIEHWIRRHPTAVMQGALVVLCLSGPLAYAVGPPLARRYAAGTSVLSKRDIPYRDPWDWFLRPWRTGYRGPEKYAREVFETLPEGAILMIDSTTRPPLDYLQRGDGLRLDVALADTSCEPPSPQSVEVKPHQASQLIARGLLFCASNVPGYCPPWLLNEPYQLEKHGHVYRAARSATQAESGP